MSADTLQPAPADPWSLYDDPERQSQWVVMTGRDRAEVQLSVAGVHCGACVATIKDRLRTIPGVHELDIQLPGERARLSWDPARQRLGAILAAIAALGYRAAPVDALAAADARRREARSALLRLFVAGFSMMQVMMYAIPVYVTDDGIAPEHALLLQWASLILTVPVVFYSALPFFAGAWRDLRNRRPGMDVPVAIGIGAAFVASAWATIAGQGEVYFGSERGRSPRTPASGTCRARPRRQRRDPLRNRAGRSAAPRGLRNREAGRTGAGRRPRADRACNAGRRPHHRRVDAGVADRGRPGARRIHALCGGTGRPAADGGRSRG